MVTVGEKTSVTDRLDVRLAVILDRINALSFLLAPFFAIGVLAGEPNFAVTLLVVFLVVLFVFTRLVCAYVVSSVLRDVIGAEVNLLKQAGIFVIGNFAIGTVGGFIYHIASPGGILALSLAATIVVVGSARVTQYSLEVEGEEVFLSIGS